MSKEELKRELDELQEFINICEMAQFYNLGLDEAIYDKYKSAVERQREIAEEMETADDTQIHLRTTAQFVRKVSEMKSDECIIEKIIELTDSEFSSFSKRLLDDYDFLIENRDKMYVDSQNVTHALLVIGKEHEDGILVDAQGSTYARYTALLPNVRSFLQQHDVFENNNEYESLTQQIM